MGVKNSSSGPSTPAGGHPSTKPPPQFMSYHEAVRLFGLLVRVQRLLGTIMVLPGTLSPTEVELLELLQSELDRSFPDGT